MDQIDFKDYRTSIHWGLGYDLQTCAGLGYSDNTSRWFDILCFREGNMLLHGTGILTLYSTLELVRFLSKLMICSASRASREATTNGLLKSRRAVHRWTTYYLIVGLNPQQSGYAGSLPEITRISSQDHDWRKFRPYSLSVDNNIGVFH
jgi:hypothetical protein